MGCAGDLSPAIIRRPISVNDGKMEKYLIKMSSVEEFATTLVAKIEALKTKVERQKMKNKEKLTEADETLARPFRGGFLKKVNSVPLDALIQKHDLPEIHSKEDGELLLKYMKQDEITGLPLSLITLNQELFFYPSMKKFPLNVPVKKTLKALPMVTLTDLANVVVTDTVANGNPIDYYAFVKDVLHEYEGNIDESLQGMWYNYDQMSQITEKITEGLEFKNIPVTKSTSGIPERPSFSFNNQIELDLDSQLEMLGSINFDRMENNFDLMQLENHAKESLKDAENAYANFETNQVIPFSGCSVLGIEREFFVCAGRDQNEINGFEISVQNKLFSYDGNMGMLVFDSYREIDDSCQAVDQMSNFVAYLPSDCCSELKAEESVPKSCPFYEINSPPRMLEFSDHLFSTEEGNFEVRCQSGDHEFHALNGLVTDCNVLKGGKLLKKGFGAFLSHLPEILENSSLTWKDISLIVLSTFVGILLLSVLGFCGCFFLGQKRAITRREENAEELENLKHEKDGGNDPKIINNVTTNNASDKPNSGTPIQSVTLNFSDPKSTRSRTVKPPAYYPVQGSFLPTSPPIVTQKKTKF